MRSAHPRPRQPCRSRRMVSSSPSKVAALASEPHAKGATEHLTVLEGEFEVTAGEQRVRVKSGDLAKYAGDVAHCLANPGRRRRVAGRDVYLG